MPPLSYKLGTVPEVLICTASALQGRMVYKDVVTNSLAVQIKTTGTISL